MRSILAHAPAAPRPGSKARAAPSPKRDPHLRDARTPKRNPPLQRPLPERPGTRVGVAHEVHDARDERLLAARRAPAQAAGIGFRFSCRAPAQAVGVGPRLSRRAPAQSAAFRLRPPLLEGAVRRPPEDDWARLPPFFFCCDAAISFVPFGEN